MKFSNLGILVSLLTFVIGQCSHSVKLTKLHSRLKTKGKLFKSLGRQVKASPRNTSVAIGRNKTEIDFVFNRLSNKTAMLSGKTKSVIDTINRSKPTQPYRQTKLKWKIAPKKNNQTTNSTKRQNVVSLIGDPNRQRLFHLDETGTLHRHEVGPEEFSTPEGKTETFSNDVGLSEKTSSDLRPAQATPGPAKPRQMLDPFSEESSLPKLRYPSYFQPTPPRYPNFYRLVDTSPPMSHVSHNYPSPLPRFPLEPYTPVTRIRHVPYPVPVPIRQPPIMKPIAVPVPYPVASPPRIHRIPYPVAVPIRSPPEIRVQKVPFPVPVPNQMPHVVRPMAQRFFFPRFQRPIVPMPVGLDECAANPCRNRGTCYPVEETYKCHCATGFKGVHCEDTSKCHPNPCENFGECTVLKDGYECSCRNGFRGSRCEVKDQCHPMPCRNGGSCTSVGNEYACSCIYGFIGKDCEHESKCFPLNPCQHGGTCHENDIDYKCSCIAGWDGISCEIPDPCSRNPCFHGGMCVARGNTYTCSCAPQYLGKSCELESQCHMNNPCQNGGRCIEHGMEGYKCHCNRHWRGGNCEIPGYSMY